MQDQTKHPFEYTLGPGPYTLWGFFAIILPSEANQGRNNFHLAPKVERGIGTCAHCGTPIINCYIVKCSDGKMYGVGSDCIEKAGLPVAELNKLQRIEKQRQKEQRAARKISKGAKARTELQDLMKDKTMELGAIKYYANHSLLSYAAWCFQHSNDGGIVIALKRIKYLLKNSPKV